MHTQIGSVPQSGLLNIRLIICREFTVLAYVFVCKKNVKYFTQASINNISSWLRTTSRIITVQLIIYNGTKPVPYHVRSVLRKQRISFYSPNNRCLFHTPTIDVVRYGYFASQGYCHDVYLYTGRMQVELQNTLKETIY